MKICDLTQSYAPTGGGVRSYIHAKRAFVEGSDGPWEHLLIVPGAEDRVAREGRLTTCTVASPLVPGSKVYRLLLRSDKVLRILEAERPDLIESHCAYTLPWTAFRHRRRSGSPVVGVYHTDLPAVYVEPAATRLLGQRLGSRARGAAEGYVRSVYQRCDATLVVSPVLTEWLRQIGVGNVEHLPLGADLELFHPCRRDPEIRRRFGVADDAFLLVYAGRMDSEKRPDLVLDAFEKLPESFPGVLVLVGEGPLRAELSARAAGDPRVHVLPFQADRGRLAALLASTDIYVSAAPHETFALSVIEAQACGRAVVGVRAGAMIERVPEGVGRLGSVGSTDELAANIQAVAAEGAREMGRRARRLVEAGFSWQRTFEQVFALYERLGVNARATGR